MRTVVAGIDDSPAATGVLRCASAVATAFGARLQAVHVRAAGAGVPVDIAGAAGVDLRVIDGDVTRRLVRAGQAEDTVALVLGARDRAEDPRPLGHTAFGIVTSVDRPVVVVPPKARLGARIRRVLVPLEGTIPTSLAPAAVIDLAGSAALEVIAIHVVGPDSPPAFTDQPQHEQDAWAREFLARYCPWGIDTVRFETRVGRCDEIISQAGRELRCDLIVLGWRRSLTPGHAPVVTATLLRSGLPVMLVPLPRRSSQAHAGARVWPTPHRTPGPTPRTLSPPAS